MKRIQTSRWETMEDVKMARCFQLCAKYQLAMFASNWRRHKLFPSDLRDLLGSSNMLEHTRARGCGVFIN